MERKWEITKWGYAIFSIAYPTSFSFTINCNDNLILEVTLSKTGKVLGSELLDSGCGSVAVEITIVSDKFTSITNGFKREVSTTSTDYDYVMTYTYQKSSIYSRQNESYSMKHSVNDETNLKYTDLINIAAQPLRREN